MSETPKKTLRGRTSEFVRSKTGLHKDTLLEFANEVIEKQDKITVTAHHAENGEIDCICLGDLCDISFTPTEQMLGCKRLQWLYLGEGRSEEERKRREDHIEV